MDKIKKILALLLCVILALFIVACSDDGGSKDDDDKKKSEETEETAPKLNQGDPDCVHSWKNWEIVKENTCTKKGMRMRTCEQCERQEQQELGAKGHDFFDSEVCACGKTPKKCDHENTKEVVIYNAECTEYGLKHVVCTDCNAAVSRDSIVPTGHKNTKTVVVNVATCTEDGRDDIICVECNQLVDYNYYYSTGHDLEYVDEKAPTCTEVGWWYYGACRKCSYTEYSDNERPAIGHHFVAGVCKNCQVAYPDFETYVVPDRVLNPFTAPANTEKAVLGVPEIPFETFAGSIPDRGATNTHQFTAQNAGTYYFVFCSDDIVVNAVVKNSAGEKICADSHCQNQDTFTVECVAGETYTIEASYNWYLGDYQFNIFAAREIIDVSQYDVVNDCVQFNAQVNYYDFTPAFDGKYSFALEGMESSTRMDFYITKGDETVKYDSYATNGDCLVVDMMAGQTYQIKLNRDNGPCSAYTLTIGKAKASVDVTGYTSVSDKFTYKDQVNNYTFVANVSGNYRFTLSNIESNADVYVKVLNESGDTVGYVNYGSNGDAFTASQLEAGKTYILQVSYRRGLTSYTIDIFAAKAPVNMSSDMAVVDSLEHDGQSNTYNFVADKDGDHRIVITGMEGNPSVSVVIYDAAGNEVASDYRLQNYEELKIENVQIGDSYTIVVTERYDLTPYTISVQ